MPSDKVHSAMVGAAVGAVVGAACLATAATVAPSNLYTATAVRPVAATLPVNSRIVHSRIVQNRAVVGAQYAVPQNGFQATQEAQVQGTPVYTSAFVLLAGVAGAVNGLFLWNNRRVAAAATTGRREALMTGVAAAGLAAGPAFAAYGDAANVFGKSKDVEQYFNVAGDGWRGKMPGKYNTSKEREFPGIVGRWEDNFDAVNNSMVIVQNVGKNSVNELGDIDSVRNSIVVPLLGKQAFEGQSISEGGFAPGRYASASILDQKEETKDGKVYYTYQLLTRTADGNEGGRHQLFCLVCSNGKLIILKSQAGDKRWFKGLDKQIQESINAFRAV